MVTVFTIPTRSYNARSFTTGSQRLGNYLDIASFWFLLLRYEIFSIDPGVTLTVNYEVRNSAGLWLGGASHIATTVGKGELGISRGDLNNDATFIFNVAISGRINLGGTVYVTQKGESIPVWRLLT